MKELKVIISKPGSHFYVLIRGHEPNSKFESCIGTWFSTYKEAYQAAKIIGETLTVVGHKATLHNDWFSVKEGREYCKLMAFEILPTIDRE